MMFSMIHETKPKCKLPTFCASSHLIGKTVITLREAGMEKEKLEFVQSIKDVNSSLDYFSTFEIASKYVEFYD